MAGLDPAIHVLACTVKEDVDARHKAGHDNVRQWHTIVLPEQMPRFAAMTAPFPLRLT